MLSVPQQFSNGHYTVILEPCTAMPISVDEAAARKQCSRLEKGQALETKVTIYLGRTHQPVEEARP